MTRFPTTQQRPCSRCGLLASALIHNATANGHTYATSDRAPLGARVARAVREEMARTGVDLGRLATATGLSPSDMTRRLIGEEEFSLPELDVVADVLDVPAVHLIRRAGEMDR